LPTKQPIACVWKIVRRNFELAKQKVRLANPSPFAGQAMN